MPRLVPIILTRTVLAFALCALPNMARADDAVAFGNLAFTNGTYGFSFPRHLFFGGSTYIVYKTPMNLVTDIPSAACGIDDCGTTDVVHRFFATRRSVKMTYINTGTPDMPVIQAHSFTLQNAADASALIDAVRQAYPPQASGAATSVPAFGRFFKIEGNDCVQTPESVSVEDANDKVLRPQSDLEGEACREQLQKNLAANAAAAQADWEAQREAQAEAARRQAAISAEQERQAAIQEKRKEAQRVAKQVADSIAALPARRAELARTLSRCIDLLSASDCGTARIDAQENYQADSTLRNNSMLCRDRGAMATAIVYQAKLNNGYFITSMDSYTVDQLLGELIDNCPDNAAAALKMRRALHNM